MSLCDAARHVKNRVPNRFTSASHLWDINLWSSKHDPSHRARFLRFIIPIFGGEGAPLSTVEIISSLWDLIVLLCSVWYSKIILLILKEENTCEDALPGIDRFWRHNTLQLLRVVWQKASNDNRLPSQINSENVSCWYFILVLLETLLLNRKEVCLTQDLRNKHENLNKYGFLLQWFINIPLRQLVQLVNACLLKSHHCDVYYLIL